MKNIKIFKESKFRQLLHVVASKAEDLCLNLLMRLPENETVGNYIERYLAKRQAQLQHEIIKGNWQVADLELAVKEIREKMD